MCSRAIHCNSFVMPQEVSTSKLTRVIRLATRGLNPSIPVELAGELFHSLLSCTPKQLHGVMKDLTTLVFGYILPLSFYF